MYNDAEMSKRKAVTLLTVKEAAALLDLQRRVVSKLCAKGLLTGAFKLETPFGAVWQIPQAALEGFEKRGRGRPRKAKEGKKGKSHADI